MDYNPIAPAVRDVLTAIRHRKRVDEIVELILDRSVRLCNAVHGSFISIDEASQRLIITSTHGNDWTLEKQNFNLKVGEGITGKVALTGIPYLCPDTAQDRNYYQLFDYVRSELAVPVIVNDTIWGIVNIDGLMPNAFDENTQSTLTVFAELAAFAITLRIELNEQERLQRHLIQSEKLASLGEIIAGIAHEINNPLTSILCNASLLTLRRGGERDTLCINAIVDESKRCAELVKNLLSFSRQEVGNKEIVGINEIISQVCAMKKYQLKVNNIRLVTETDSISYPVSACRAQIQQVLLNLVNNAEHAIPVNRLDGLIRIRVNRHGEKIKVLVIDNGKGIAPEVLQYIFDPFFTTKAVGEGTGLGLSIARSIAEAHGGNLSVESSSPDGTAFCFELPLALSPETPRLTLTSDPPLELSPVNSPNAILGRVLLIDDEPLILDSLTDFLRMQNVHVQPMQDSRTALHLIESEPFDVIVSDIRMPGLDGLQLYEKARAIDKRYATNFVFMSGDLVRESTKAFVNASGCACLEKPFAMDALYRNIAPFFNTGTTSTTR
jgi:signal transduction histidine kinase/CheY-like chemotaxis protein